MKHTLLTLGIMMAAATAPAQRSLVPQKPSTAPDYYCTWNLQGYICSYGGGGSSNGLRYEMQEHNIFEDRTIEGKTYQAWIKHYEKIRPDLYFVLDDSWDIPVTMNQRNYNDKWSDGQRPEYGLAILDTTRFPSFTGDNTQRLRKLAKAVEKYNWKGLGGWVAANKCQLEPYKSMSEEEFWKARLTESKNAGVAYWKVDWGTNSRNEQWRRQLSAWADEVAPELIIEHGSFQELGNPRPQFIPFSEVLRTYDVDNHVAIGQTISRVAELLPYTKEREDLGIINCEDEPYIAAGLGCAIGVMRHPLQGPLPNGNPDRAFFDEDANGRRLKQRLDEVVRGVRWHRIALPFGVNNDVLTDSEKLGEQWEGVKRKSSAPARVSRNMPLPIVKSQDPDRPYVLASRYPTGQTAVVTMGRSLGNRFVNLPVEVAIEAGEWNKEIGIFGYYKELTITYDALPKGKFKVWAQDLAGDKPVDITKEVVINGNSITIPGSVISRVGLSARSATDDISDPGLVLICKKK